MTVLGWWELPEEDQPPEQYWGDDDALKEWFEAVKQRRKDRANGDSSEPLEEVPQVSNEWARELLNR
jgi:hypothetical protein